MAIYLTELDENKLWFPSPYEALSDPNGLLAFGGDLSPDRLLLAYQNGIFPWYGPGEPLLWWSPSPRAVFDPKTFKPAKSLKKFQRKHKYRISINLATESVIDRCASMRPEHETWLNHEMRSAYKRMASLGHCHSVEVWSNDELIGGLYGLSIGQVFCGESMFSQQTNASKIALWYFCEHFKAMNGKLIDCQVMNPHLKSLGAQELERDEFMQSLLSLRQEKLVDNSFKAQWLTLPSEENQ
ncbi:leucyl/phenylalanyl-tRNA--protein transferase [Vibrio neptunius]|uniref:leucyl/phenylalanyl-tRNA--protein transferase n=1 Tax=Vibrio neptunius TaxID=170651 RepID=UPI0019D25A0D|nr:leucyl/phenylalanyl-tRNA--protein transferase [Vibrio neptunius]MBN3573458.1 leucyl/phenylalanyl-tRNA--protein transferase [Vibrio neptunius]QXX07778.1 leucyl/phenylalanyl-tRNA--protein transferase [Vibrio neptunius]